MTMDNMIAYAKVDEILNLVEDTYKDKIPEKIRNFFKEERDTEHKIQINTDIPLNEGCLQMIEYKN